MPTEHPTHQHQPTPGGHWSDRAPMVLRDDTFAGPAGEPCFTPTDRRWLWRLAGFLLVNGTNEEHRQMRTDLLQYLYETCEHHWDEYEGDQHIPAHRQCVWCCTVEPIAGDPR